MDRAIEAFGAGEGMAIGAALGLVLVLQLLLPRAEWRRVIAPLVFVALHVVVVALEGVFRDREGVQRSLHLLGLALILLSIGRSGFLLVVRAVLARRMARPLPRIFQDLIQALVYAAVGMVVLRAAGVEPGSLLTTSALLTAVIGLSLQDTLGNMFAGLAIQAQRPFDRGDWIQYDAESSHIGKVIEMNWRAVTVQTLERVEMIIPNSKLADTAIRNFSKPTPLARREVFVWAPHDVPPHRVQARLVEAIADVVGVMADPAPSVLTSDFTERGVQYWVRYFVTDFDRREIISAQVRDRVWYALHRMGVAIPPPARHVQLEEVSEATVTRRREKEMLEREQALTRVPFLAELPTEARRRLAEGSRRWLFAPDEIVIREGQVGHELFIIESGEVRVLIDRAEMSVVELARLGPGSFFGEMSLLTGERRRATVRTVKETELIVVSKDALQPIMEEMPDLAEHMGRKLAEREIEMGERVQAKRRSAEQSVEERTNVLLSRIRKFFSL